MSDAFLSGCDFCLLDFCVADVSAIQDGAYSYRSSLLWAEWACHQARRNGCEPIFVIIPLRHHVETPHALTQMYRDVARRLSCCFLDVRDVVSRMEGGGVRLYRDVAHPGEALSRVMATVLERFMLAPSRRALRTERVCVPMREVERLSVVALGDCAAPIRRPDTIVSFCGVDLVREGPVRLRTGGFSALLGVLVNAAACTRDGAFTGSRRVVKQLTLRPYSRTEFEARLVPFTVPIQDGAGSLTVSASETGEPWEDASLHAAPASIMPHRLEIADVLVARGVRSARYEVGVPAAAGELDLSRLF